VRSIDISSFLVVAAAFLFALGGPAAADDDALRARAAKLAQDLLIVDTHVDVPYRLLEKMEDVSERTEGGHFDYPRARAGGLNAPFMSIYVPADYEGAGAKAHADHLIDMVEKLAADSPEKFALADSPDDLLTQKEAGLISLPMGMENGAAIEGKLENLKHFYDRGIRYVTLAHSESNHICDSSYDANRRWKGLSPFGRELVAEMNRLGVMVDVSHVSDDTFYQVLEVSKAPAIASHSSCRKFTPGWERNVDDDMIRLLAEKGGVVQVTFGSAFLREDAQKQSDALWGSVRRFAKENGLKSDDPAVRELMEKKIAESPPIYGDVGDVVAHIDHVVRLVGVDHVGLGSDFDGVTALPEGLKDVSAYPNLIYELLKIGYSEADLAKICGGNLLRVWRKVEEVAAQLQVQGS